MSALIARSSQAIACLLVAAALVLAAPAAFGAPAQEIPAKLVVLTFDDAVKSHRAFVAPLLKNSGSERRSS